MLEEKLLRRSSWLRPSPSRLSRPMADHVVVVHHGGFHHDYHHHHHVVVIHHHRDHY
ncbi:MAG: hypothetical protein WDN29_00970 [Methylovirgula sp.]